MKPLLVSCYLFKIEKGQLVFSRSSRNRIQVRLTGYSLSAIQGLEVRSFTITPTSLSIVVRKEVASYVPKSSTGIDRNASNVTYGNQKRVLQFSLAKVEEIARTTSEVVRSFRRNDVRIRKRIASKYGKRRKERVNQILHRVSKSIVQDAKANQTAIVFEDIKGLRNLYRKGNYQGRNFRARMNSIPWYEIKRQIEYKAKWEGVPVLQLTKGETRGTSKFCPACGERLQVDGQSSRVHRRELWCERCRRWSDGDEIAVANIAYRGWLRFGQSFKGEASEAMVQEPLTNYIQQGAILRVDRFQVDIFVDYATEELTEPFESKSSAEKRLPWLS